MGWLLASLRVQQAYEERRVTDVRRIGQLESALSEHQKALEQVAAQLKDRFAVASREALQQNRDEFLALAQQTLKVILEQAKGDVQQTTSGLQQLVKPMQEALAQYQENIRQLETRVKGDYGALSTTSEAIKKELTGLRQTAQGLTLALAGDIRARGEWGQLQLERVADLAGLKKGIDYEIQVTTDAGRPDMVVYLPENRRIAVDAKAPAVALSGEVSEADRKEAAARFAAALAARIKDLAGREYWRSVGDSLDLVVLFVGAEGPLALAVETHRSLIDDALRQNVLIATPATLYAVFKAIAATWKSHHATEEVQRIVQTGRDLYIRLAKVAEFWNKTADHLERTVKAFNEGVGSFDARLVPGGQRLYELGAGDESRTPEALEVRAVNEHPRRIQSGLDLPSPPKTDESPRAEA
jgi:DNA recombination protein RmuC